MHNQFKTQKFKHLMLAMGPRDLNSAPYSPLHCSSHSMTSFQSSELTELPVVENSQLFAQRVHSAHTAHGTPPMACSCIRSQSTHTILHPVPIRPSPTHTLFPNGHAHRRSRPLLNSSAALGTQLTAVGRYKTAVVVAHQQPSLTHRQLAAAGPAARTDEAWSFGPLW